MEHDEQAARLERDADEMEERSDKLDQRIHETRRDWEAKEQDSAVPGAQPEDPEQEESVPGVGVDEELVDEEGGP
jgi:hypothetical protein